MLPQIFAKIVEGTDSALPGPSNPRYRGCLGEEGTKQALVLLVVVGNQYDDAVMVDF
jgi:hypothetical protein